MKKIALFALLFAAAATAASAQTMFKPLSGVTYFCDYVNPTMDEVTPDGASRFDLTGDTLLRGIETFLANHGVDQRKVTFAKPANRFVIDPVTHDAVLVWTRWEFTINPGGPQCTSTLVSEGGQRISFQNCSDGHSRVCTTYF